MHVQQISFPVWKIEVGHNLKKNAEPLEFSYVQVTHQITPQPHTNCHYCQHLFLSSVYCCGKNSTKTRKPTLITFLTTLFLLLVDALF